VTHDLATLSYEELHEEALAEANGETTEAEAVH
jgi:hypothetical protein